MVLLLLLLLAHCCGLTLSQLSYNGLNTRKWGYVLNDFHVKGKGVLDLTILVVNMMRFCVVSLALPPQIKNKKITVSIS